MGQKFRNKQAIAKLNTEPLSNHTLTVTVTRAVVSSVLMIRFRLCSDTMSDHPKFDLSSTHVVLTLLCACTVPSWVCASKYRARNSSSSTLVESVLPSACMLTSESLKDLMCLGTTWYQLRIMQRTWQLFNPL